MTVEAFFQALMERGLQLSLEADGRLKLTGPGAERTAALREYITEWKDEIVAHLKRNQI